MGTKELHRRRLFAGFAMIVAPLAAGIAYLVAPQMRSDTAEMMEELAAAPGRVDTALIIGLFSIALFVFVAFGLGHLLREDLPWYGQIGTLLAVTGLTLYAATQGGLVAARESAALDPAAAAVVYDNATSNPVMYVAIGGFVAAAVGFLVLALGLTMARTAPVALAAGFAIGVVVVAVATFTFSTLWLVVGFAIQFLALAPLGYELIAEPDEAWEHPAHFEGMRPVLG